MLIKGAPKAPKKKFLGPPGGLLEALPGYHPKNSAESGGRPGGLSEAIAPRKIDIKKI